MQNTPSTPRSRMLSAYQGTQTDRIPVAPEFWNYLPARLLGLNMIEFQRELPHWKALQKTFRHYQCDGWGIVSPAAPPCPFPFDHSELKKPGGRIEQRRIIHAPAADLVVRRLLDPENPPWSVEKPIKDFERDWPSYEKIAFPDPTDYDWQPAQEALSEVGEDYLLEVHLGDPFTDFVGGPREGDFSQMILDLQDHREYLRGLRDRYVAHRCDLIRDALTETSARSIFVGCAWSCASLLGPSLWREWDKPVIEAFTRTAHRSGGLVHVHCHGDCAELIEDFAEIGVDCLCPLERPPGGDVTPENMPRIRRTTTGTVTLNGNVHTVETLIRGTPQDVEEEVRQIIDLWGGGDRLIVGTGDQVGAETPDENIRAMIETVKSCQHP